MEELENGGSLWVAIDQRGPEGHVPTVPGIKQARNSWRTGEKSKAWADCLYIDPYSSETWPGAAKLSSVRNQLLFLGGSKRGERKQVLILTLPEGRVNQRPFSVGQGWYAERGARFLQQGNHLVVSVIHRLIDR